MKKIKTILATTYAVHPTKGSEDAMGWNYIRQIARFNRVICITRENNRPAIDKHIIQHPDPLFNNIQFVYFDTPYWTRFWKKGSRGAMLYYWMWQRAIPAFVRKKGLRFDIAHNVTFPNDWTPSYLWKLGKPFVWGPIGHHPLIPAQYLAPFRKKYWLKDRLTWMVKNYFWRYSPALKRTIRNADFIYAMNSSVRKKISLKPKKHLVFPSVATQDFGWEAPTITERFHLISAGRFVPLKGFDLTILAYSKFVKSLSASAQEHVKLTLVGKGPEEEYLKQLIREHQLVDKVEIINWVERAELMQRMRSSDLFMFPSHEGAGMVVAEALSFGLPVVCLDNCGPGELIDSSCGFAIPEQSYSSTVEDLSAAIKQLYSNPNHHLEMKKAARSRFKKIFRWDVRGDKLASLYDSVVNP